MPRNTNHRENEDGSIRRNLAHVTAQDRTRLRNAILEVHKKKYGDGISYWFKQDEIHESTEVHDGPAFLTWHRELLNNYEALLKEVDPGVALHYWDWTTDPLRSPDGLGGFVNLFTSDFLGGSSGPVGAPLTGVFDNNGVVLGNRKSTNPQDFSLPPMSITRNVNLSFVTVPSDLSLINTANAVPDITKHYSMFRTKLESLHNDLHVAIGGNIASGDTAFEDPFVYMYHSNIDRLWAMWQTTPGFEWRLDGNQTYGIEGAHPSIADPLEPWAGKGAIKIRPWTAPDNQQYSKTSKHPSVVIPPIYDSMSIELEDVLNQQRV